MLEGYYDTFLVLISILVAMLASYTALTLAGRVSNVPRKQAAWWVAGGAFAMGTGIWSMHFIGMLAFRIPIPLGYDLGITLLSWILPIAVSALALWQIGQPHVSMQRLLVSSLLLGVGINAMHYVGMAAMRMHPGIIYDYGLVLLSLAIAVGAATISLWIAFRLRHNGPRVWLQRAVAAAVMGGAIAGMHYTGMAAASFPVNSVCLATSSRFGLDGLAIMVMLATLAVLTVALLISTYDARLEARMQILTRSQAAAEERQRLLESERAAREELERMGVVKDQFLATLSHELRTPLNAILGWIQLLQLKPHDATALKQALQTIERNAWMQARLIDDLLDMSRISAGNVRLDGHLIDPAAVADAALDTARPAAMARRIELITQLDRSIGQVWADASRLQQVMWNLIANAVKFTPEGGWVRVSLAAVDGHAEFSVCDNGIGIRQDFLPQVFDRFTQAESGTTRRYSGLGLGLSIAKQLIELHGGTISVHSEGEGKGACFVIRLPLSAGQVSYAEAERKGAAEKSAPGLPAPVKLQGIKVLAVDDETDTCQMLERLLRACGADVTTAGNAQQALALLDAYRPDIVISDIAMADIDGLELMRRLRRHPDPRLAGLPALALTALTRQEDIERARQAGFNAHLRKPLEAAALLRQVAALTQRSAGTGTVSD